MGEEIEQYNQFRLVLLLVLLHSKHGIYYIYSHVSQSISISLCMVKTVDFATATFIH